jgi:hypothetical protein
MVYILNVWLTLSKTFMSTEGLSEQQKSEVDKGACSKWQFQGQPGWSMPGALGFKA